MHSYDLNSDTETLLEQKYKSAFDIFILLTPKCTNFIHLTDIYFIETLKSKLISCNTMQMFCIRLLYSKMKNTYSKIS